MHQQSLMLLHLKMQLQENTLLPCTLDIVRPMHQQSLILLHPTVKKKMHLQQIHYLTLTYGRNVAQCPLEHVTYAHTEFEVTASKG